MGKKDFKLELYKARNTVFTTREISLLLGDPNRDSLKAKINYYVKKGVIKQVRRGIYVKDEYDKFELATRIYVPSYISLETVLQEEGIIFQHYEKIFVVSYLSRVAIADGNSIVFRKVKDYLLLNSLGLITKENYTIATKERAFLDSLYLYHEYHFDNLDALDRKKVIELAVIYQNKQLLRKIDKIFK
jgi:hypothetical protein